jgi:hypothetical protein
MAVWIFGIHSSDPFGSAMLLAGFFGGLGRWSLVRECILLAVARRLRYLWYFRLSEGGRVGLVWRAAALLRSEILLSYG